MPTPEWILTNLARISNDAWMIAFAWHCALTLAGLLVFTSGRPSARAIALLLSSLMASVSLVGFAYGNPFNGVSFALLAALLFGLALRLVSTTDTPTTWSKFAGALLLAFGWFYPHFLDGRSLFIYGIAAPLGLIPCPTLAFAVGLTLLVGGLSRPWAIALSLWGIAYGLFGFGRLGVRLDGVLVAGAVLLGFAGATTSRTVPGGSRAGTPPTHSPPLSP